MNIEIDGVKRKVIENLGYVQDIGAYVKVVMVDGVEKKAVKRSGKWVLWGQKDRTAPLLGAFKAAMDKEMEEDFRERMDADMDKDMQKQYEAEQYAKFMEEEGEL